MKEITEKKRAEIVLRESEEKYKNLVELSPNGIAIHQEGKFVFVNKAGGEMLGFKPEELLGKPILSVVHPDYIEIVKKRVKGIVAGSKVPLIEEKFIKKDGTPIDVEVVATSCLFKGKPAVQVVVCDITERKRAEEKLSNIYELGKRLSLMLDLEQISREVLKIIKKILNFHNIAILLVDEKKKELITYKRIGFPSNIPFLRLPLKSRKGIVAKCAREGKTIYTPDVSKNPTYIKELSEVKSNIVIPLKVRKRVLGVIDVESEDLNAFSEEDKRLLEILASQTAIALENARLYENLQMALRKAREESEMKIKFIKKTSHEFINPISIAKGYLELLLKENGKFRDSQRQALKIIKEKIDEIDELIQKTLNMKYKKRGDGN